MWREDKGSEMKLREAAEQALEALMEKGEHHQKVYRAAEALREALAKREWVGLTDEESLDLVFDSKITEPNDEPIKFGAPSRQCIQNLISHVEAKLKEKNT